MGDYSGVTNPRRVMQRREEEAGTQSPVVPSAAASAPPAAGGPLPRVQFTRSFSEEDRKKQRAKLEEMLRKRGPVSEAGAPDPYA